MKNGMLTIIEIAAREDGGHGLQSQSGRTECWEDGWIAVPDELVDAANACCGYCRLDIRDGGLVGLTPTAMPEPPAPEPTEEDKLREQVAALEGQLTDTQLALCDVYEMLEGGTV